MAEHCEASGANGITVHPRPDERHIRYQDVENLKHMVTTELNVEGNPTQVFMRLMESVRPHQVTLVPDEAGALTSDAGWDTQQQGERLRQVTQALHNWGCRVSVFVEPHPKNIEEAAQCGVDRVELYTGPYARRYAEQRQEIIENYVHAAHKALELGLGVNAGHDLNRDNLAYFKQHMPQLHEVSIGQALVADALYFGMQNTIQMYQRLLSVS